MTSLREVITALTLAAAIVLAAWIGRRDRRAAVLLALLSVVWIAVDKEFEGPVLASVARHHGLTLADLVGLGGLVVACGQLVRSRRKDRP